MRIERLIYITILFLVIVTMFAAPFIYIIIRLHEKS